MKNSMLAARLGLGKLATKNAAPVASPVMKAGNHAPAPAAAEGKIGLDAHHAKFTAAHKKGDHASAKTHALNYANAASKVPGEAASQPPHGGRGASGTTPPKGMTGDVISDKGF